MRRVPAVEAAARGTIAAVALGVNTVVSIAALMPFALAKLLLPARARAPVDRALNAIARGWIRGNDAWIAAFARVRWDVGSPEGLDPRKWYVVSSNHQTWVDIFVLQHVFNGRVPLLKFLLKRELMYVPLMGFAWWALDFPFLRRSGGARASQADRAATRRACERFRAVPTSVLSFLEGTRYTPEKARGSTYRHLLEPRTGGLATALATLGGRVHALLDVTIVYPQGVPTFLDFLCGRTGEVVVRAREVELPAALGHAEVGSDDPEFRRALRAWVRELWSEKDRAIEALVPKGVPEGRGA